MPSKFEFVKLLDQNKQMDFFIKKLFKLIIYSKKTQMIGLIMNQQTIL
jgi:hypothetical protein